MLEGLKVDLGEGDRSGSLVRKRQGVSNECLWHATRSLDEVTAFENALAELAENPQSEDLPNLHLILDDRCQQPEVMFSLIHFLESFDALAHLKAFVTVVPELIIAASEWTKIIHNRILNDESACNLYRDILHSFNSQSPNFVRQLLEESATYHLNEKEVKTELARQV